VSIKSWAQALLRVHRLEEEQCSLTKAFKDLFEIQKQQGEKMASLQQDVDRLNTDVTAFQAFVQAVKAYIGANPTINTAPLEQGLSNLEASLAEGKAAVEGANQQPQV